MGVPSFLRVCQKTVISPQRSWLEGLITKPDADGQNMYVLLMRMCEPMTDITTEQRCGMK